VAVNNSATPTWTKHGSHKTTWPNASWNMGWHNSF